MSTIDWLLLFLACGVGAAAFLIGLIIVGIVRWLIHSMDEPPGDTQAPSTKWRGTGGTTDNFTATWDSDQTTDTFSVMALGSTKAPHVRTRMRQASDWNGAA